MSGALKYSLQLSLFFSSIALFSQNAACITCAKLGKIKKNEEALKCFKKAIKETKEFDFCLYYQRAYLFYELNDFKNAKKDLKTIFKNYDSLKVSKVHISDAYFMLARINSKENEKTEEFINLNKSISYNKNSGNLLTLAYAYGQIGEYEKAVIAATEAIEISPKEDYAYNNRAYAYIMLGKLDLANADLEKALLLNPQNPYIYKHRGILYLKQNNKEKACMDFQQALKYGYREFGNEADKKEVDELIKQNCN